MSDADRGAVRARWLEFRGRWQPVEAEVIEEALVTIYANGREMATIMCTPRDQLALALGLLKNEGRLESLDEVVVSHVSRDGCCVDLWLRHPVLPPARVIVTSGCGGGVTFDDPARALPPLTEDLRLSPDQLVEQLNELHFPGSLHARTRGVHAAGLSDGEHLLARVEDVGRHNTIDKLTGDCLLRGIETRGRALLATGRVSSEMLRKAALMGCPIVASRNSPTSLSVALAEDWNLTLVGYVRRDSLRAYAHAERLGAPAGWQGALPIAGRAADHAG
ncbi:MAG TPA: formate dehydrogenase accessory sulfurtransferase FdhD [Anaerolineales bacterium]|nr:formate dehydrogenase accessory sulfurtransferase FdhD [Anaerolineales bacterium]